MSKLLIFFVEYFAEIIINSKDGSRKETNFLHVWLSSIDVKSQLHPTIWCAWVKDLMEKFCHLESEKFEYFRIFEAEKACSKHSKVF